MITVVAESRCCTCLARTDICRDCASIWTTHCFTETDRLERCVEMERLILARCRTTRTEDRSRRKKFHGRKRIREHFLRLRHINSGYWRMVSEFSSKETRLQIKHLTKVVTDLGRGRAWLYTALNECLLESYIRCFLENRSTVRRFYVSEALVMDRERMDILLTMAQGLEFVIFNLDVDVPYLDLASFQPKPRSMTSESMEDSDDHISLSSMDSDASSRSRASSIAERTLPSLPSSMDTSYSLDEDLPCVQETEIEERLSCLDIHPDDSLLPIHVQHTKPRRKKLSSTRRLSDVSISDVIADVINSDVIRQGFYANHAGSTNNTKDLNANSSQMIASDLNNILRDFESSKVTDEQNSDLNDKANCDIEPALDVQCMTSSTSNSSDVAMSSVADDDDVNLKSDADKTDEIGSQNNERNPSDSQSGNSSQHHESESVAHQNEKDSELQAQNRNDSNSSDTNLTENHDAHSELTETLHNTSGTFDDFYASRRHSANHLEKSGNTMTPCQSPISQNVMKFEKLDVPFSDEKRDSPFVDIVCENGMIGTREVSGSAPGGGVVNQQVRGSESRSLVASPVLSGTGALEQLSGEIRPDNNLTLFLVLEMFTSQHEKPMKVYVTCIGYVDGDVMTVYLVLSDRGLYVVTRSGSKYKRLLVVHYTEMDYLSLSLACQIIEIVCVNRRRQFWLATGDACLNSSLVEEMSKLSSQPLTVLTDATTQRIAMKKWIARETRCLTTEVEILHCCLGQWEDAQTVTSQSMTSSLRHGRLMYRRGDNAESSWRELLFTFRDGVLYKYEEEGGHNIPHVCVDFTSSDCRGCRRCPSSDRDHTFEILVKDRPSVVLSAKSRTELEEWLGAMLLVVAQKPPVSISAQYTGIVPCCAVVTSQHLLLCHEDVQTNFFRTLASASLDDVTRVSVDDVHGLFCVVEFDARERHVTSSSWVLYMTSRRQTDQFTRAVDDAWTRIYQVSLPVEKLADEVLRNRCLETVAMHRNSLRKFTCLGKGRPLF